MANIGKRYRVIDRAGKVVAEGTAGECAKQMERGIDFIYRLARGECSYPEYWVVPIDTKDEWTREWDELIDRLRKQLGLPSLDNNKEVKG